MSVFRRLWARARALFSRILSRKPPEPGRFEQGSKGSFLGFLTTAPWVLPRRDYLVYVPQGHVRWQWRRRPLIVLLHGCRQTPEVVAAATRIGPLADDLGCLVLLPRQKERANPWGCWNWFEWNTARGHGEAAIIAAQIRKVRRRYRVDRQRVVVAGLSSGGGLAAVLGVRRPDLVAGVFVHSGVACGAASSPLAALGVLKSGADRDVARIGLAVRERTPARDLPVPLVAIQGERDGVVAPVNATQLVRQYLALNGHPAALTGTATELPPVDSAATATPEGRKVTTREWHRDGRLVARYVEVDALGHAWSGGDPAYPYNDPAPPDATALLGSFVGEVAA
jgi:poly(hydroxyalkanoate) depolymerase family esterase